ncbi:MAG: patatin-like phospholipase family protein, partial [Betaproteobacteria bacterium]|nr:patatin-like phospholipase family protein [Betaproteobacteria bacterium]
MNSEANGASRPSGSTNFKQVFEDELAELKEHSPECDRNRLVGLAFSGGGIRSATFNLGVIQSLARNGLLGRFDYLSTVSGGGYIGSWLSAQLHRTKGNKDEINQFQSEIKDNKKTGLESESVTWLRQYSNYLTPKKGLSGDTLAAIGTWLRNTLLNQATLGLFFASLILLLQMVLLTLNGIGWLGTQYSNLWLLLSVVLICCAIALCVAYLPKLCCCACSKNMATTKKEARQPTNWIILIAVAAAYGMSLWIYSTSSLTNAWTDTVDQSKTDQISLLKLVLHELPLISSGDQISSPMLTAIEAYWSPIVIAGMWAIIYVLPWVIAALYSLMKPELKRCAQCSHTQDEGSSEESSPTAEQASSSPLQFAVGSILSAVIAGAFGGWLIYQLSHVIAQQSEDIRLWWAAGFGTPLLLMIFCLILVLHQGLMARMFRVSQLEWWARLGGYVLLVAAAWAGIHALLIYAPPLLNMLKSQFIAAGGLAWAAHSLAGIILGKSAGTSGQGSKQWKEWITRAAPYVFVLGCLVATSWGVHALMHRFGTEETPCSLNLIVADDKAPPP